MPGNYRSGGRPTPTPLRLQRGNAGKRPLNKREPRLVPHLPPAPKTLSKEAKGVWRKLGRQLLDAGIVTALDRIALEALVESYCRWLKALQGIQEAGLLVRVGNDPAPRANPLLRIAREAQVEFTRLLGEFGMTPSSRTRVENLKPEEINEFEELLKSS